MNMNFLRSSVCMTELPTDVYKRQAYSSAVGAGAFVSEIFGEEADELRKRGGDGGEFGATTGRPRRMGWFDCVASKYGCRLQGATDVAFTVLDLSLIHIYSRHLLLKSDIVVLLLVLI